MGKKMGKDVMTGSAETLLSVMLGHRAGRRWEYCDL